MRYLTDADLAEKLGVPEKKVAEWRLRYGWPHMKVGRQVRYTLDDIAEIERRQHVAGSAPTSDALPGQTALSAARSA